MSGTRASETAAGSPLRAPAFWLALLVLVVNDHLLKGADIVPAWLTGKLSDVAGLVVAPVVAAELCRGRLRALRALAASAVVLGFVLTELSEPAARIFELGLGALGIRWRLWPDASDLLALAVLPLTFRLLALRSRPGVLGAGDRLALALACVACLATSDIDAYVHHPFLLNHAGVALELRARFYEGVSCDVTLEALAAELAAGPQPAEHALHMETSEARALDAAPRADVSEYQAACGSSNQWDDPDDASVASGFECVAVRLEADGLGPQLMRAHRYWTRDSTPTRCAPTVPLYEEPGEGALVVGRVDGQLRLIAHRRVELRPLP